MYIEFIERQKMRKAIILLITILISAYIYPTDVTDDTKTLKIDIDTSLSMALKNNLSLKNSKIDLNNKLLKMATSWNSLIPNAGLSVSMGRKESTTTVTGYTGTTSRETTSNNTLSAGFSLSLSINPRMGFDIAQTVFDYQSGKLTYDQAENDLIINTNKIYYNIVIMKQQLDLKQKQIENTKKNYEISLIKLERGMISEIDKLKSEYAYKSLLPDYKTLENTYLTALANFKLLIGVKDETNIELTSAIPEIKKLDYEKIEAIGLENNLNLKILQQTKLTNENLRNIYISQLFPSFGISYSASASFGKDFTKDAWFDNMDDWNNSGTFTFSVSMPLDSYFPFSSTQVEIIQTQNNIRKNLNDLESTRLQKTADVQTDIMNLKQIEETIDSLSVNLDIAEKTYDLTQKLYEAGSKNYLDLQDSQNNLYDSQIKLINAKYNFLLSYLDLKYLLNVDHF